MSGKLYWKLISISSNSPLHRLRLAFVADPERNLVQAFMWAHARNDEI